MDRRPRRARAGRSRRGPRGARGGRGRRRRPRSGRTPRSRRSAARATTAAASAALPQLAMASGRSVAANRPVRSSTSSSRQDAHQVAGLVRARHVAGLVLHPDRRRSDRSRAASRQGGGPGERRGPEAAPVHGRDRRVELADQVDVAARPTSRRRGRRGRRGRASDSGRTASGRASAGQRIAARIEASSHHVVDVVAGTRPRQTHRERLVGRGLATAAGADHADRRPDPRGAVRHPPHPRGRVRRHSTPVRALNSSISSSQAGRMRAHLGPEAGPPTGLELLDRHALLLDPGEVAEVEDAAALRRRRARAGGPCRRPSRCSPNGLARAPPRRTRPGSRGPAIRSISVPYISAPSVATVTIDVVRAEPLLLRDLDRRQHVADAREAERGQRVDDAPRARRAGGARYSRPAGSLNSTSSRSVAPVRDGDHDVGGHHVVDERDVLVADALDVVLAEAVLEQRRALERLDGDDQRPEPLLEVVAGADRAGRAGRRHERAPARRSGSAAAQRLEARARARGRCSA